MPLKEFQGKSKVGRYGDYVYEIDGYEFKLDDKIIKYLPDFFLPKFENVAVNASPLSLVDAPIVKK